MQDYTHLPLYTINAPINGVKVAPMFSLINTTLTLTRTFPLPQPQYTNLSKGFPYEGLGEAYQSNELVTCKSLCPKRENGEVPKQGVPIARNLEDLCYYHLLTA